MFLGSCRLEELKEVHVDMRQSKKDTDFSSRQQPDLFFSIFLFPNDSIFLSDPP